MKRSGVVIWLILTILALVAPDHLVTQNIDSVDRHVSNLLTNHYKKYPQEKVFVHTDKDVYAGGQTIWYKAYTTAYGKPSKLSGILYVQLTDSAGNVVVQNKLKLRDGAAHGNIDLPDSLHSGWYQLAGFTAWMMNFDKAEFYHQKIYVQNLSMEISRQEESIHEAKYHISFFPEGGDPVEGGLCNIAFKAVDDKGDPVKVDGTIVDADKKVIAKIITVHDGMGLFAIEGYAGRKNTAIVTFPDKTIQTILLPDFKKTGVTLQANATPADAIEVRVAFNGNPQQYRNMLLAAYQTNGIIQTYLLQLSNGMNIFDLRKQNFTTGVVRLTLFNQDGIPQAERIVFVNKHDQLNLSLAPDTLSFLPGSRSSFTLASSGRDGKPLPGNFSIAVLDADATDESDNIRSWLLMSSELKGKEFHPAYYFKNNSDTLQQQLDLVMLTNGWRHFRWDKDTVNIKYGVEKSQYLAGQIAGYNDKLYASERLKTKLMIQNQDSSKYFGYVTPDSTGSFLLGNFENSGMSEVFMETVDPKNRVKKLKVNLFNVLADSLQHVCFLPLDSVQDNSKDITPYFMSNALKQYEERLNLKGIILKTVHISERKLTPVQEVIRDHVSTLYDSDEAFTLDLIDSPPAGSFDIIEYIKGRFPGLQITTSSNPNSGDRTNQVIFVYHGPSSLLVNAHPYFYLNESPITLDDVYSITMTDVALIRFLPPPVVFAPLNGGSIGAIMIYTKNYKDDRRNPAPNHTFDRYTFNGYTITREFPVDYRPKAASLTDTRTTLYWNHDLDTDSSGKVRFRFYNSDKAKKYRIIIQGMDAEGRLAYLNEVF